MTTHDLIWISWGIGLGMGLIVMYLIKTFNEEIKQGDRE